jgi:hypothetical protein
MKPTHYYSKLYNIDFYFFINWPAAEFEAYLDEHFDYATELHPLDNGETGIIEIKDPVMIYTWIRDGHDPEQLMVHEAVHMAGFALDWVGIQASHENDEALAYLAEYLWVKAIHGCDGTH